MINVYVLGSEGPMNVNEMSALMDKLLHSAQDIVDSMPDGTRKKLNELAAEAGTRVGMDEDEALPHITWFAHRLVESGGVELSKGRTGGLYKGQKPAPQKKSRKKLDV